MAVVTEVVGALTNLTSLINDQISVREDCSPTFTNRPPTESRPFPNFAPTGGLRIGISAGTKKPAQGGLVSIFDVWKAGQRDMVTTNPGSRKYQPSRPLAFRITLSQSRRLE